MLTVRERIHTSDKPFSSSYCDNKCSKSSSSDPMKESTQEKKHSVAPSVTTRAQIQAHWRSIKEPTLGINHSAAHSVTISALDQVVWRHMKESIKEKNHSVAPSVKRNSHNQVI